jgi:hypothetical protein
MFRMTKSTEMRHLKIQMARALVFPALLSLLSATTALAAHKPSQAPKAGDMAVSANLGFATAFEDNFNNLDPAFTGTFEYYSTPRVSWRGLLGFTSFEADNPSDAEVDFTFVNGNVSYNWEGGWVHPFVTGGLGFYSKDASPSLPSDIDGTELGVNFGGGLDWFLGESWALKFEGTVHGVAGEEPDSFFLGTVGFKWWF